MIDKLPTIKSMKVHLPVVETELMKVLLAHEQYYKKDLKKDAKQFEQNIDIKHTDREIFDLGRKTGRLEAILSLRGEKR
jgi:hypothetical protein